MIINPKDMEVTVREHMRGGDGQVESQCVVPSDKLLHSRLFAKLTLNEGCSIGEHQHSGEIEYYYILSGNGIVTEADGDHPVAKGDVVITGWGNSHAIRNSGKAPLELLAFISVEK